MRNGMRGIEDDENWRPHLRSIYTLESISPLLDKTAALMSESGRALQSISDSLAGKLIKIGADTARAISDTVELKRHLKAITDREQGLQRELNEIKVILRPKQRRKVARQKAKKR